jgi:hypothetical protein
LREEETPFIVVGREDASATFYAKIASAHLFSVAYWTS